MKIIAPLCRLRAFGLASQDGTLPPPLFRFWRPSSWQRNLHPEETGRHIGGCDPRSVCQRGLALDGVQACRAQNRTTWNRSFPVPSLYVFASRTVWPI